MTDFDISMINIWFGLIWATLLTLVFVVGLKK